MPCPVRQIRIPAVGLPGRMQRLVIDHPWILPSGAAPQGQVSVSRLRAHLRLTAKHKHPVKYRVRTRMWRTTGCGSARAIRNIRTICEENLPGRYDPVADLTSGGGIFRESGTGWTILASGANLLRGKTAAAPCAG